MMTNPKNIVSFTLEDIENLVRGGVITRSKIPKSGAVIVWEDLNTVRDKLGNIIPIHRGVDRKVVLKIIEKIEREDKISKLIN